MRNAGLSVPEETAMRAELSRVLEHKLFQRSKVLSSLLSFLADRAIRKQTVTESVIAAEVLALLPREFHPYKHSNVRVQMHNLRERIESFYRDTAPGAFQITLPKNSYCLVFEPVALLPGELRRTFNQARLLSESRHPADLFQALSLLAEVRAQAPEFGLAHAIQAEAHISLAMHGAPPRQHLELAEQEADLALERVPEAWESQLEKGAVLMLLHRDWDSAATYFSKASLRGGLRADAHPWRQIFLLSTGRANEAIQALEGQLETHENPPHLAQINYGICLHLDRRHKSAEEELKKAARLYPAEYSALSWLALVQWTQGDRIRALASQTGALVRARRSPPGKLLKITLDSMTTDAPPPSPAAAKSDVVGGGPEMAVAFSALMLRRHGRAMDAFERMIEHHFPLVSFLIHLQMVDPLWRYPRFRTMVDRLKLPVSAFAHRDGLKAT